MFRSYAPAELEQLLFEINAGTSAEEILIKLDRSASSLVSKLKKLYESDPTRWDTEKVHEYVSKFNSEVWRLPRKQPDRVKQSRQRVLAYLREHPNADAQDFENDGLVYDLSIAYDSNRINAARRDLDLEEKHVGKQPSLSKEQRRQRLLDYLKEHPNVTMGNINNTHRGDVSIVYGGIDAARRDAEIIPVDYISAAQSGRELGITRERISQLFEKGQLDGCRVGRRLYISLVDVENRKQMPLR